MKERHWADVISDRVVNLNKGKKTYVCQAGITPSGTVHIGNFRDLITAELISRAIKDKGLNSRLYFVWDDYDRFRKVPKGLPKSFSKYLGMPVSEVPDPFKCHKSYAEHFEKEFEDPIKELGINPKFIYAAKEYKTNTYYKYVKKALKKRLEIARILSQFKTQDLSEREIQNYYPYQVYCNKCRKDSTEIMEYDGNNTVTYSCKCGFKETVDISRKSIGKLVWKVDWAMRWTYYKVDFEPGGRDHSTPGGSYDISKKIVEEIFSSKAPVFQGYDFVGISGMTTKMSSSTGMAISPGDLLKIYEPELLRWLFARVHPKRPFNFCFDSELIRQYNEFDNKIEAYFEGKISEANKRSLILSKVRKEFSKNRIPFRQAVSFGQIAQGNVKELKNILQRIGQKFDDKNLKQRLEKSQNWVKDYAKDLEIKVRDEPNKNYYNKLPKEEKEQIDCLRMQIDRNWNIEKLTMLVYSIPKREDLEDKENRIRQRNFFKNVYQMFIEKDTGPRLGTFLMALGKEKVKILLTIK